MDTANHSFYGSKEFFGNFAEAASELKDSIDQDGYPVDDMTHGLPQKMGGFFDFDTSSSYRTGSRYMKTMKKSDFATQVNDAGVVIEKPLGRSRVQESQGFNQIIKPTVKRNTKLGYAALDQGYIQNPWDYNNPNLFGEGAAKHGNPHIRNKRSHAIPDYDSIGDRFYKPLPSRRLALESTDAELFQMLPGSRGMNRHPTTVVSDQHKLNMVTKTKKNHDVHERPWYRDGEMPRGLTSTQPIPLHPYLARGDTRMPVANAETGDKSTYNRIQQPYVSNSNYTAATNIENMFTSGAIHDRWELEHDIDEEIANYNRNQEIYNSFDPTAELKQF